MNTTAKFGIFIALAGAAFIAVNYLQQSVKNFKADISKFGKPKLAGTKLTLPIEVRFNNPTAIPITLTDFVADLYVEKNGIWVPGGKVEQTITIPSGESLQKINPVIDLKSIFGGNFLNTMNSIMNAVQSQSIQVKANVKAKYQGIALASEVVPPQTISF